MMNDAVSIYGMDNTDEDNYYLHTNDDYNTSHNNDAKLTYDNHSYTNTKSTNLNTQYQKRVNDLMSMGYDKNIIEIVMESLDNPNVTLSELVTILSDMGEGKVFITIIQLFICMYIVVIYYLCILSVTL
jgi:hypothetical protein